jgi:hypothetical protein
LKLLVSKKLELMNIIYRRSLPQYSIFRSLKYPQRCLSALSSVATAPPIEPSGEGVDIRHWPGKYRYGINLLMRRLGDKEFSEQIKTKYINPEVWSAFQFVFRRRLMKDPIAAFAGNVPAFERFATSVLSTFDPELMLPFSEVVKHPELRPRVALCEHLLFKEMIRAVEDEHKEEIQSFRTLCITSDLRHPHKWYPFARLIKRKIIFHGGPTNSGKVRPCSLLFTAPTSLHHTTARIYNHDT